MPGTNKNSQAPEPTIQELKASITEQGLVIAQHEATIASKDESIATLEATIATLQETVKAANADDSKKIIADQEATITDLIEKLEKAGARLATGEITLKHKKITYKVIGHNVPTLGLDGFNGAKTIPAEELENHPELIERYLKKGHGFIVPVVEE